LDATLPGGVLGDVYRGVQRGRGMQHVGRGLRVVFWERFLGQIVEIAFTLGALIAFPSPLQRLMPLVALVLVVAVAALLWGILHRGSTRWSRFAAAATVELRGLTGPAW